MEWKLLRIFLQYPDRGFYTKEISRLTGIGAGTVNNFLRNIQKDNILIKEIVGNVHLYKLNNELELIKHLKIVHTLLEFKQHDFAGQFLKLDETVSSIILYGSHANGRPRPDSDIDLAVVSRKFGKDRSEERVFLLKIAGKVDPRIEPVPISLKSYRKDTWIPLIYAIRRDGIDVAP